MSIQDFPRIFAPALTASEKLIFQICNPRKVGKVHGVQMLQCCPSMDNIEILKGRLEFLR